jgi:hypothetical protein
MKRFCMIFILLGICTVSASVSKQALPVDDYVMSERLNQHTPECLPGRIFIAQIGNYTGVLGAITRNICVSSDGNTIAVVYGPPSDPYDSNHPFDGIKIAYSTDRGMNWSHHGPYSSISPLRAIYPSVDGCANFHEQAGNIFFCWQEGQLGYDPTNDFTMLDKNIPSLPSFSSPIMLAGDIDGWFMCPAVNPDDSMHVIITAHSFLANGNFANYCWISTDGGYIWTDTIRITPPAHSVLPGDVGAGHIRWGTGNYAFFTYTDTLNGTNYPHYVETTDGGFTWSDPDTLPAISVIQHWYHERDCEVINDLPFAVHNDNTVGGFCQMFYPDPDDSGSPGSWNWTTLNVESVGEGAFAYQGTTWTVDVLPRPSIAYDPALDVILLTYRADFSIAPPPAGWTDGWYLGGILSTDQGRSWYPCRPLSDYLGVHSGLESAHRLVTTPSVPGTTYVYSTWTDALGYNIGNQYFELGVVMAIQDTIFGPGVEESHETGINTDSPLTILPTVARDGHCVSFNMPKSGNVSIKVFDSSGRLVNIAFDGYLGKGNQTINLDTSNFSNGVYIISCESPWKNEVGKLILVR